MGFKLDGLSAVEQEFNFNKNLAFGYINSELSKEDLAKENLFIEVQKKKYPASIILKPLNSKNIRFT